MAEERHCFICGEAVAMLDEEELCEWYRTYMTCVESVKAFRERGGAHSMKLCMNMLLRERRSSVSPARRFANR